MRLVFSVSFGEYSSASLWRLVVQREHFSFVMVRLAKIRNPYPCLVIVQSFEHQILPNLTVYLPVLILEIVYAMTLIS